MIFIILLLVPIIEIYLFIKIGEHFGTIKTILVIILTAIIGSFLIKKEGIKALSQIKNGSIFNQSEFVLSVSNGLYVLLSGILLLTPGFITDTIGLLLFSKKIRQMINRSLLQKFTQRSDKKRYNENDYNL